MLEKWKSANRKSFGALLPDISKAFDCLSHGVLIVKLNVYEFSISASRLVQNYLSNRKQSTKINSDLRYLEENFFVVPQGSILGPLSLKSFLCDLFFLMNKTDFASYADDNNIVDLIINLQNASLSFFQWFYDNQVKVNLDKSHFICSTYDKANIIAENQNALGVRFDSILTFNGDINPFHATDLFWYPQKT